MKALLTGPDGQAGQAIIRSAPAQTELICVDHSQLDITASDAVHRLIRKVRPTVVINAAAYTDVERAESEREQAYAVNALGAENLAHAVSMTQGRLVQLSTDYVFSGVSSKSLLPSDHTAPINAYGETKLAGERKVVEQLGADALIIRTSWLYYQSGHNFVRTMLRLMARNESIKVVCDQIGAPSWADSLAGAIWDSIGKQLSGTYHWRDAGVASWFDFAVAISEIGCETGLLKHKVEVEPVATENFPTKAQRPSCSLLNTDTLERDLGRRPNHWRCNLKSMMEQLRDA